MPVSTWMIEQLSLQPGQERARARRRPRRHRLPRGRADRFRAGRSSPAATQGMLDVARERAKSFGLTNVEFKQLQLEWIDLPTASVDAVLCRWGFMLIVDPPTAMGEARRVLRPGRADRAGGVGPAGREPVGHDHQPGADRGGRARAARARGPGMFALARPGAARGDARRRGIRRHPGRVDRAGPHLPRLRRVLVRDRRPLADGQRRAGVDVRRPPRSAVENRIRELAAPFTDGDGRLMLPGSSLAASASS